MRTQIEHIEFEAIRRKCEAAILVEPSGRFTLIYWSDRMRLQFREIPEELRPAYEKAVRKHLYS